MLWQCPLGLGLLLPLVLRGGASRCVPLAARRSTRAAEPRCRLPRLGDPRCERDPRRERAERTFAIQLCMSITHRLSAALESQSWVEPRQTAASDEYSARDCASQDEIKRGERQPHDTNFFLHAPHLVACSRGHLITSGPRQQAGNQEESKKKGGNQEESSKPRRGIVQTEAPSWRSY